MIDDLFFGGLILFGTLVFISNMYYKDVKNLPIRDLGDKDDDMRSEGEEE